RDDGQTDQRLTHAERNRDFGGAGYDEFPAEYNADEPDDQNNNQSRPAKFLTFLGTIGFRRVIHRNRLRTLRFLKYVEHINYNPAENDHTVQTADDTAAFSAEPSFTDQKKHQNRCTKRKYNIPVRHFLLNDNGRDDHRQAEH